MRLMSTLGLIVIALLAVRVPEAAAGNYPRLPLDDGIYAISGNRWVKLEAGHSGRAAGGQPYYQPGSFPVFENKPPVLFVVGTSPSTIQARTYESTRRLALHSRRVPGGAIITFRDSLTPGKYVVHGVYGDDRYVVGFEIVTTAGRLVVEAILPNLHPRVLAAIGNDVGVYARRPWRLDTVPESVVQRDARGQVVVATGGRSLQESDQFRGVLSRRPVTLLRFTGSPTDITRARGVPVAGRTGFGDGWYAFEADQALPIGSYAAVVGGKRYGFSVGKDVVFPTAR